MSSKTFFVKSIRDGKIAEAKFEKGNLIDYSEKTNNTSETGTIVGFIPDKEVFKNISGVQQ